ncbi:hypothetical protein L249_3808, partial [Ophiocordyceps polyrhachis-furcata BCC 54312]
LREILLALCVTPTPKAPPIISLLSKVSNFTNLFSKEKASALLPYYSSQDYYIRLRYNLDNRIGFLFRSLEGKARKTLETYNPNKFIKAANCLCYLNFSISNSSLLTKTKDNSLSYKDFYSYIKDSKTRFKNSATIAST